MKITLEPATYPVNHQSSKVEKHVDGNLVQCVIINTKAV
jgi:hypothetical protein